MENSTKDTIFTRDGEIQTIVKLPDEDNPVLDGLLGDTTIREMGKEIYLKGVKVGEDSCIGVIMEMVQRNWEEIDSLREFKEEENLFVIIRMAFSISEILKQELDFPECWIMDYLQNRYDEGIREGILSTAEYNKKEGLIL